MRTSTLGFVGAAAGFLAGCSAFGGFTPPQITYDNERPAVLAAEPPKAIEVVEVPKPLPLPGQLMPAPGRLSTPPELPDPRERVDRANSAARVQPTRSGYINAVQVYPFAEGALYQVYATPEQVTDIALQEGEQLVGSGPVAAGDTARWIIGDTESGVGAGKKIHILVKPVRPDIVTNLVINTDRRTYHLELRATPKTYMGDTMPSSRPSVGDWRKAIVSFKKYRKTCKRNKVTIRDRSQTDCDPNSGTARQNGAALAIWVNIPSAIQAVWLEPTVTPQGALHLSPGSIHIRPTSTLGGLED